VFVDVAVAPRLLQARFPRDTRSPAAACKGGRALKKEARCGSGDVRSMHCHPLLVAQLTAQFRWHGQEYWADLAWYASRVLTATKERQVLPL
jgi:hypothetical protein